MKKLKRVISFVRRYGLICVVVVGGVIVVLAAAVMRRDDIVPRLMALIARERQLHDEYVRGLEDIDAQQARSEKLAHDRAAKILAEVDHQYRERGEELDAERRAKVEEIINEYADDPERMTREFADKMGFEYVQSK